VLCVLPPGYFGQSIVDMGSLRIELAGSLKGRSRLGKLPRRETRIPMRKGLES
jgi:hypothetical protein